MTVSERPTDSDPRPARVEAGARLRAAREGAGRSAAELATQLKVAPDRILALEAGDWDSLHDAAFARGLLRAAAKALRADPEGIMDGLPPAFVVPGAEAGGGAGGAEAPLPRPPAAAAMSPRWRWVAAAAIAVAAVLILVLPRVEGRREVVAVAVPPPPALSGGQAPSAAAGGFETSPASTPAPAASTAAPTPAAPGAVGGGASARPAQPAASAAAALPAHPTPAASAARAPAPGAHQLDLRTDAASWVEVRGANGAVLYSGMLAAGVSRAVAASAAELPLKLTVGNVAGTHVNFDGAALDLASPSGGNVAHLTVPKP